ncbi:MAG TPA: LOG family protein [Candidatus Kapabacteria bacterium]|jgi:hypothetical protein
MKKLIAVFGPDSISPDDALYREAERLGALLAGAGFAVVTGGYDGVMEAASKGARGAEGQAIGVTAEVYYARGREANPFLTREVCVKSATDRLMELLDLPDAWCAIGNSTGTLAEVAMAWDYMTKGFLEIKPLILIGESWEQFLRSVNAEASFRLHIHFVQHCPHSSAALDLLTKYFGPQQNFPELEILK